MTASEKILQKTLVGSHIDSSQWSAVQAGLRDRAFFSAQVQEMRTLAALRQKLADRAAGRLSESEIRRDMRQVLAATGYQAPGTGIQDLSTKRRLDLVMQTNVQQARGYVQYLEGTQPGALLAFPAQELIRVRQRNLPRDWHPRWRKAGGHFVNGNRMIALKTDPIWTAISAFGTPFPPFDFNSGMGLRDISRREAIELGIIAKDEKPKAQEAPAFNQNLYATLPEVKPGSPEATALRSAFGDQIEFSDGVAKWVAYDPAKDATIGKVKVPAESVAGVPAEFTALIPALVRAGGSIETLTGEKLVGEIVDGILKKVTIQ